MVYASCTSKARSAANGIEFIKKCLPQSTKGAESPARQGDKPFKRMSYLPHPSSARQKISRMNHTPMKQQCEGASLQQPLARRSVSFRCSSTPIDKEICRLQREAEFLFHRI